MVVLAIPEWVHIVLIVGALLLFGVVTWVWYSSRARRVMREPLALAARIGLAPKLHVSYYSAEMRAEGLIDGRPLRLRVRTDRQDPRYDRTAAFDPGHGGAKARDIFAYGVHARLMSGDEPEAGALAAAADDVRTRNEHFPREVNSSDFELIDGWVGFSLKTNLTYRGDAWLETAVRSVVEIANRLEA
jgi:hypothetical protein